MANPSMEVDMKPRDAIKQHEETASGESSEATDEGFSEDTRHHDLDEFRLFDIPSAPTHTAGPEVFEFHTDADDFKLFDIPIAPRQFTHQQEFEFNSDDSIFQQEPGSSETHTKWPWRPPPEQDSIFTIMDQQWSIPTSSPELFYTPLTNISSTPGSIIPSAMTLYESPGFSPNLFYTPLTNTTDLGPPDVAGLNALSDSNVNNMESFSGISSETPWAPLFPSPASLYQNLLQEKELIASKEVELNWSGRGQHVEYRPGEEVPLKILKTIGHSATALIEAVKCRRIVLARKSIRCTRTVKLAQLIPEVEHLHRLRHPHIIQLVGSYVQGRMFAILLYPVAHFDLTGFMDNAMDYSSFDAPSFESLYRFFFCLTHALEYMHKEGTKHMDIKPANILVKLKGSGCPLDKVYFADFGISRRFTSEDATQTDDPIAMTRKWCSPEVYEQKPRGRASDIFSLGCVFAEMCTVISGKTLDSFAEYRAGLDGSEAFHSNLPRVREWVSQLPTGSSSLLVDELLQLIGDMLEYDPAQRPTAVAMKERMLEINAPSWKRHHWNPSHCCDREREPYEVDRTWEYVP